MKQVKKCKKTYGKKNVAAFTELATMMQGAKCFDEAFAPACKDYVMESYVVPMVNMAFGMSGSNITTTF